MSGKRGWPDLAEPGVDLAAKVVSYHPDPVYIQTLITSGLLILATYLFLIIQSQRQHSKQA